MTLSSAEETVFLAATVPELLSVNHHRDGRTDGGTDIDDSNRGKSTFGCVSPKKNNSHYGAHAVSVCSRQS